MNTDNGLSGPAMIWRLARKDMDLVSWPMLGYLALVVVSALFMSVEHIVAFNAGAVMLISTIIVVGAQLIFGLVIGERKEQTLAYMLSLPVSPKQYSAAKLLVTVGVYLGAWLIVLFATLVTIQLKDTIPDGLMPFAIIIMQWLFIGYLVVLGTAILTESEGWTIVSMTIANVSVSIFIFAIAAIDDIGRHIFDAEPVWNAAAARLMGLSMIAIILMVLTIGAIQSRKTDFT
ncbi:MAG: hypothetical protein AAGJ52_00695 [Pseudomonadota bacterium]